MCTNHRKKDGGSYNEAGRVEWAQYLLKRWLLTLILVLALKSSGSSMTGAGTWLRSLICAWSMDEQFINIFTHRYTYIYNTPRKQPTHLPSDWLPTSARSTRGHSLGTSPLSAARSASSWFSFGAPARSGGWRWPREKTSHLSLWAGFFLLVSRLWCKAAVGRRNASGSGACGGVRAETITLNALRSQEEETKCRQILYSSRECEWWNV